ncbi:MAG TPA: magnesium transporter [Isosphaeraceae bacterium]|jgi:magnesium transporter|nr:magnesium transporter [Isosphaeraceae bacterium]
MRHPLLVPEIRELLRGGDHAALVDFLQDQHPARVAEIVEDLGPDEGDGLFGILPPRQRAGVMSYMPAEDQVRIVGGLTPEAAAEVLRLMPHDDRADLANRLDKDRVEAILRRMAHAEREDIRRLASYEPGTAGAVMTTDYAALSPDVTVREAIHRLPREAPDRETIDHAYVVGPDHTLLGQVSFTRLVQAFLARPDARVEAIMQHDPIVARLDEDQEAVADKVARYDLAAIPVVDAADRLVGIITHDDVQDILRREQTEDILKFGGVTPDPLLDEAPYWQGRIRAVVRRRINWLLMLFLAESLTGTVLRRYQWVDRKLPDLDLFIPLLIGTGGNAGSQTVGTILRALALGDVRPGDVGKVVLREGVTGLLLGLLLGAFGFVYASLWRGEPPMFAAVVGLAIVGICLWANLMGALVPLLARRLGMDPAVISAPLITTLVDATGLVIYYSIAIVLLLRLAGS